MPTRSPSGSGERLICVDKKSILICCITQTDQTRILNPSMATFVLATAHRMRNHRQAGHVQPRMPDPSDPRDRLEGECAASQ